MEEQFVSSNCKSFFLKYWKDFSNELLLFNHSFGIDKYVVEVYYHFLVEQLL
jgi:hypothetical protein